jgi:hypothetical protein
MTATSKTPVKARRTVTLDESQYQLYRNGHIDIVSPSGELLDRVGDQPKLFVTQEHNDNMYNQLSLVEALLVNSTGQLELSPRAIEGMATLLAQSREFIEQ